MPIQQVDARMMLEPLVLGPLIPLNIAHIIGGKFVWEVFDDIVASPALNPTVVTYTYLGNPVAILNITYGADIEVERVL